MMSDEKKIGDDNDFENNNNEQFEVSPTLGIHDPEDDEKTSQQKKQA